MLNSAGSIKILPSTLKGFLKVILKGHHQFEDHFGSHNITSNISDYHAKPAVGRKIDAACQISLFALYFDNILHWIFKSFKGEVATLWAAVVATGWPGRPQHWPQALTPSPALPAATKGLGLATRAYGDILGSNQNQRNASADFQKRASTFVTLLSIKRAFRDARNPPGSSCFYFHCDVF